MTFHLSASFLMVCLRCAFSSLAAMRSFTASCMRLLFCFRRFAANTARLTLGFFRLLCLSCAFAVAVNTVLVSELDDPDSANVSASMAFESSLFALRRAVLERPLGLSILET
eukprot:TRINITY_DN6225_c0_g1_i2.p1 TRINITY_DN6225_c0_g1~~TRINITY_DN6225_c0_g1_i2.p1  ORF type:complete len:112 (-),score=11.50 TRINITY_DN6225_c0_g1_i2:102-437(-)